VAANLAQDDAYLAVLIAGFGISPEVNQNYNGCI
jgi:hypothetical protein